MKICNAAGYRFFCLDNPERARQHILQEALALGIKGTVILAEEGINLYIAADQESVLKFREFLIDELCFPEFDFKFSYSEKIPHKRMLVKVRPEICTMGLEEIDSMNSPAPYITAQELKKWLDEGRDFVLLDTRKRFEYEMGSFEKAISVSKRYFKEFPEEVQELSEETKSKPIVTFCTGGIRCEKAAPMMLKRGFGEVYQLEGGVLKYFEECGGEHWRGDCFVFDHRAAVTPELKPVEKLSCTECSQVYSIKDLPDEVDGLRLICPDCYKEWRAMKDKGIKVSTESALSKEARIG